MKNILKNFEGSSLKAQLIRGFAGNSGLKIVNILFTLVSGILLARMLGAEGYGIYAFVLSIIALLGLPTQGGLPTLVMRETAHYQHIGAWNKLRGLLESANVFVIVVSIVTGIISAVIAWRLWGLESSQTVTFLWALLLLPLISFGNVRGATLRGLRKVVQGNVPEQVVRPIVMVTLLFLSLLLGFKLTPELAMHYTLLSVLISFMVGVYLLNKSIPIEVKTASRERETSVWLKSVVPLTIFSSLNIANSQVAIVVIGLFSNSSDVGLFKVAFQGAALLSVSMLAIEAVIAPHIVKLYKSNDCFSIQKILTSSSVFVSLLSFPLLVFYLVWGEDFLKLLFGVEFIKAFPVLVVLSCGQFLRVLLGPAGLVLNMMGFEKYVALSSFVTLFANVVLCVAIVPFFGVVGAAVASSISTLIWSIFLAYGAYKKTNLNATVFKKYII